MKSTSNDFAAPDRGQGFDESSIARGGETAVRRVSTAETGASHLLISVRSEREIVAAISAGADIVDLKEPRHGALAPTGRWLWQRAVRIARQAPDIRLSAALGEPDEAIWAANQLPGAFNFAKAGPSGCDSVESLRRLWNQVIAGLDPAVELVAVAYADHRAASCLPAAEIFAAAADFGFGRCLIDTFTKDGRTSWDCLGTAGLRRLADIASDNQLWWALAGSMRLEHVAQLRRQRIAPNCWGVRGDVCDQGRDSTLVIDRVARWNAVLQQSRTPAQPGTATPQVETP